MKRGLLIVSRSTVFHNKSGGLETQLDNLIESLKPYYKITVLTTSLPFKNTPQKINQKRINNSVEYIFLKDTIPGEYGFSLYESLLWQIPVKRNFYSLNKSFRLKAADYFNSNLKGKYKIILSQSSSAQRFKVNNEMLVSVNHGTTLNEIKSRRAGLITIKDKIRFLFLDLPTLAYEYFINNPQYFKKCSKIVLVSKNVKEDFIRQHKKFSSKAVVIPNGVDCNKFKPKTSKNNSSNLKVFYVGRIDFEKGLKSFINVSKALPKILFSIYGDGPDRQDLIDIINKKKLNNLRYFGAVSNTQVSQIMSESHIFLFLTNRKEGMPMSILEALSSGCVVLSSFVYKKESSPVIYCKDYKQAIVKIKSLNNNRNKLKAISESSRKFAYKNYSYLQMGKKYRHMFNKLN